MFNLYTMRLFGNIFLIEILSNPVISHFPARGAAVARGVKIKGGKIGIREKGVRVVKFSLSSLHALLPASLVYVWPA